MGRFDAVVPVVRQLEDVLTGIIKKQKVEIDSLKGEVNGMTNNLQLLKEEKETQIAELKQQLKDQQINCAEQKCEVAAMKNYLSVHNADIEELKREFREQREESEKRYNRLLMMIGSKRS